MWMKLFACIILENMFQKKYVTKTDHHQGQKGFPSEKGDMDWLEMVEATFFSQNELIFRLSVVKPEVKSGWVEK